MFDIFAEGLASASFDPALTLFASVVGLSPGLPPLPPVQAGTYYARLADGSLTGDGRTVPLLTLAQVQALPVGSKAYLWGGDTFLTTSGQSFAPGAVTIGAWGTGQAFIKSNNVAIAVAPTGNGTNLTPGIKVINDGSSWAGISTNGPFGTIGCDVSGFGYEIVTNNHDWIIDGGNGRQMFVGGTVPTSSDQNGVFCNPGSYNIKIRNIELAYLGGLASADPSQTGFGWHLAGISDGGPDVPLAYTNGVPNNALCEIGPNVYVHDCGGNITGRGGGSNSGGEIEGRRIWIHGEDGAPVIFKNIRPLGAFSGFDEVGLDPDIGAEQVLIERIISFGNFGGAFITYAAGGTGTWGPVTIRYCLAINSGYDPSNDGNFALQGNGQPGVQNAYGNTTVQVMGGGQLGSLYNVRYYQMSVANGIFANNAVITLPNWYAISADQLPGSGFVTTHNGWFGPGGGFQWAGQTYQTLAEWAAAVNADVNGLDSDPLLVGTAGSTVPSDYALQAASPWRGNGIDLSQAPYNFDLGTTDLMGNAVQPGTPPHRGAHAYGAGYHVDNAANIAALAAYDGTIPSNPSGLPAGVTHGTFWSALTQMNLGYTIYLPPQYATEPYASFPVVYWFSGGAGAENLEPALWLPYLQAWTGAPFIFVWVNAGAQGWAMDPIPGAPMAGIWEGQSTPTNELIPFIDATYRTRGTKGGRAIVGMSGGGAKALRLAVVRPDLFSSVYGFAPALVDIPSLHPTFLPEFFNNNLALYTPETVQNETTSNAAAISGKIAIHLTVGTADGLYTDGTVPNYDAELTSLGIPHDPLTLVQGAIHDTGQLLVGTSGTSADALAFVSGHFF
jgi:hypothetical protein